MIYHLSSGSICFFHASLTKGLRCHFIEKRSSSSIIIHFIDKMSSSSIIVHFIDNRSSSIIIHSLTKGLRHFSSLVPSDKRSSVFKPMHPSRFIFSSCCKERFLGSSQQCYRFIFHVLLERLHPLIGWRSLQWERIH